MRETSDTAEQHYAPWAGFFRWGIVLVALVLLPGVAFLGEGIGKWLRTKTESGWAPHSVRIHRGHRDLGSAPPPTWTFEAADERSVLPEESAAMYDGRPQQAPMGARFADFESRSESEGAASELVPAAHQETALPANGLLACEGFAALERQIQELGAIYYALESDRKSGYSYRFECIMPAAGGRGAQERFVAPGRTAVEAVETVLRQLRERTGRQP